MTDLNRNSLTEPDNSNANAPLMDYPNETAFRQNILIDDSQETPIFKMYEFPFRRLFFHIGRWDQSESFKLKNFKQDEFVKAEDQLLYTVTHVTKSEFMKFVNLIRYLCAVPDKLYVPNIYVELPSQGGIRGVLTADAIVVKIQEDKKDYKKNKYYLILFRDSKNPKVLTYWESFPCDYSDYDQIFQNKSYQINKFHY